MRINQISRNNYNQAQNYNNYNNKKQTFKGALDPIALGVADTIENGGLAVSFTLQDVIGTILPRPLMGLRRNSDSNGGKKNLKFAAKELIREALTGPSMFIIPAIMLRAGKNIFGKTIDVPAKSIKALNDIQAGQSINKTEFYEKAFTTILQNAKSETAASENTIKKAQRFTKMLERSEHIKDKKRSQQILKQIATEFIDISKQFASDPAHADFTSASLSESTSVEIKEAIGQISSYADDIIKKTEGKTAEEIKNLANKKIVGRFAMNAVMFGAVMAFLQIIPKLYNKAEGEGNAGLEGLVTEDTQKDETAQTETKTANQDKSKPSFGSSAPKMEKLADAITKNEGIISKFAKGIEFAGFNLSFPLLLSVMGFGVIIPRIAQAKDKYDRSEIIRRDVITCTAMCFGEKALRKGFSKVSENQSGLVLAAKEKGFEEQNKLKRIFDYIRPIKGVNVLNSEQIISKYSDIEKYKEGIKGFCDFIDGQGGNLEKLFGLTDESKILVEDVLKKEGKTLKGADNKTITDALDKAKDSESVKKLINMFKSTNNPWVKKAKTINARFTALSVLVLVPGFLGILLPLINEKITKKRLTQEVAAQTVKNNSQNQPFNFTTPDLFDDIANFKK